MPPALPQIGGWSPDPQHCPGWGGCRPCRGRAGVLRSRLGRALTHLTRISWMSGTSRRWGSLSASAARAGEGSFLASTSGRGSGSGLAGREQGCGVLGEQNEVTAAPGHPEGLGTSARLPGGQGPEGPGTSARLPGGQDPEGPGTSARLPGGQRHPLGPPGHSPGSICRRLLQGRPGPPPPPQERGSPSHL